MKAADLPRRIDLGDGRTLRFTTYGSDDVIGAIEEHVALRDTEWMKAGQPCSGGVFFDVPENDLPENRPRWTVESWNPLTLSPSVLCMLCGNHGFIRESKWVPA